MRLKHQIHTQLNDRQQITMSRINVSQPIPDHRSLPDVPSHERLFQTDTSNGKRFAYLEKIEPCSERLQAGKSFVRWILNLSGNDVDRLAKTVRRADGSSQLNAVIGSRVCRIRCVYRIDPSAEFIESNWVNAETAWPPTRIAFLVNNKAPETQTDAPLDITSLLGKGESLDITSLLREGQNIIKVATGSINDRFKYELAMETTQITDTKGIKERLSRLSCANSKDAINLRTFQNAQIANSEIQIPDSKVIINITDPMTGFMCDLPARGKTCRHNECFDLDTFLSIEKPESNQLCGPDGFKCPFCGADARPQNLVIDGFLVNVIETLQQLGHLNVKTILFEENGSWQVKEEERIEGFSERFKTDDDILMRAVDGQVKEEERKNDA